MFMRAEKHCGPFNASAHTLFFRNGGFGYFDEPRNEGVTRFESNRPNCWLSFISAEGLALWPTSDSGCRCDLAISCSVALVHDEQSRVFGDFACQGELLPIKQLALNLGGPGDRRDASGQLWLSYPRVKFTSSLELPIKAEFEKTSGVALRNSTWTPIAGTPDPWIYASSMVGLKKLQVTLRRPADGAAKYKVALLFAAPPTDKTGTRVFDVKLQGQVVKAGLDVAQESGGTDKALVLKFDNINVTDDLIVELATKTGDPLLCGLQVMQVP
ncbi:MAG: malectin [Planctomycetes bacterium]|nr:malectin [Planctomycetota bacterium]